MGDAWSPAWAEAGFLHDNLRTPTKTVDRIALLDRLAIYLVSHPESQGKTQKIIATFKPLSTNLPQEQAAKPLVDFRPGVADGLLWTLIAAPLYQAG